MTISSPQLGYCGVTIDWEGDCSLGLSGSWRANQHNITGVQSCARHCQRRCPRCNFISFSADNNDCSWFNNCPLPLQTKFAGFKWRSLQARARSDPSRTVNGNAAPIVVASPSTQQ